MSLRKRRLSTGIVVLSIFFVTPLLAHAYTITQWTTAYFTLNDQGKVRADGSITKGRVHIPYSKRTFTFTQTDCIAGYTFTGDVTTMDETLYDNPLFAFEPLVDGGRLMSSWSFPQVARTDPPERVLLKDVDGSVYVFLSQQGNTLYQDIKVMETPIEVHADTQLNTQFQNPLSVDLLKDVADLTIGKGTPVTFHTYHLCSKPA